MLWGTGSLIFTVKAVHSGVLRRDVEYIKPVFLPSKFTGVI